MGRQRGPSLPPAAKERSIRRSRITFDPLRFDQTPYAEALERAEDQPAPADADSGETYSIHPALGDHAAAALAAHILRFEHQLLEQRYHGGIDLPDAYYELEENERPSLRLPVVLKLAADFFRQNPQHLR